MRRQKKDRRGGGWTAKMQEETGLNDVMFSILLVCVNVHAGVLLRPPRSPRVLGSSESLFK